MESPPSATSPQSIFRFFQTRSADFFSIIALLILPGLAGWFFLEKLETEDRVALQRQEQENMREVLGRISEMSQLQSRFNSIFQRIAHLPWTAGGFSRKAATLLKKQAGLFDLYVFGPDGRRATIPGTTDQFIFASQQFLQAVRNPHKNISGKLVTGFAGNSEAARLLAASPGTLVDLMNGDRRTWGGWWPLKDSKGNHSGDFVVFVHRNAIPEALLLDQAVQEANALIGQQFQCGWLEPVKTAVLHPVSQSFPAPLRDFLLALPIGTSEATWKGASLVLHPNPGGELLFGLASQPTAYRGYYQSLRLPWGVFLAIVAFILHYFQRQFKSLRTKLIWQFSIGGGFPLIIFLATVAIDRQDRETLLIQKIGEGHLEQLTKLDGDLHSLYLPILQRYQDLHRDLGPKPLSHVASMGENIHQFVQRCGGLITRLAMVNRRAKILFFDSFGSATLSRPTKSSKEAVPLFGLNILNTVNQDPVSSETAAVGNPIAGMFINAKAPRSWLAEDGLLQKSLLGKEPVLIFFKLFRGSGEKFRAILIAIHDHQRAQKLYLTRILKAWPKARAGWPKLMALPADSGGRLPPLPNSAILRNLELQKLRDQVLTSSLPQHRMIRLNGRKHLVSALRGRLIDGYVIMLARPLSAIQAETILLTKQAGWLSLGMLFIAGFMAWLTARLLLVPLDSLGEGLTAMKQQDFKAFVTPGHLSELSLVANKFNSILSEMRDLEVAKSIQETLWPPQGLSGGQFQIIGHCQNATNLGGDFHDWFIRPDGKLLFAVGDVAGHGIPAGLVTASMKIALALKAEKENDPATILSQLNRTLRLQVGSIRPMTLWLGLFDPVTGLLEYANAGGCYPVIICGSDSARLLELPGFPLGSRKKAFFQKASFDFSRGGRLLAYTDGFPEAQSSVGKPFGYEQLLEFIDASRADSIADVQSTLFEKVKRWAGRETPEDDQTLVVLDVTERA